MAQISCGDWGCHSRPPDTFQLLSPVSVDFVMISRGKDKMWGGMTDMDTMDCMDNKKTVASLPQIILDVNEISGNCIYSEYNKQYHVRSEGKFSVTAKITGVLVKLLKYVYICLFC